MSLDIKKPETHALAERLAKLTGEDVMHSFMAVKRHGRPEEVAGMVAWLAGPEAAFVTGAMHTIDGAFGA
jgi:NAD(P)-dependent dehydrogenase (short-subunit alcohol dehydrogenase family)